MPLAPGTIVEAHTGRRGEVVSRQPDGRVAIHWAPSQTLPDETTVESETAFRIVPEAELGNEPLAPGKGWAPEEIPVDPIRK